MYIPQPFKNENTKELLAFIRANNFGMLISEVNGRPWVTHVPFMLNAEGTKLTTHISRANQQGRQINLDKQLLVVFSGPHAYVSASWYDHENVPTWNYIALHVYGLPRIIEDSELKEALRQLVNHHEEGMSKPVSVDTMTPDYLAGEMRGIIGLELEILEIQAAYKLSQNRDKKNYENIVRELEAQNYVEARAIADAMRSQRKD